MKRNKRLAVMVVVGLVVQIALPGCVRGCGGGEQGSKAIKTISVKATVHTDELGGVPGAPMNVLSVWQERATPESDGVVRTRVSSEAPQLLFAESSGELRGLALSIPQEGGGPPDSAIVVDAESTAVALVFMSFGVLTTDPAEAAARVSDIKGLPEYDGLLGAIKEGVVSRSLAELVQDDAFQESLAAVVGAWWDLFEGFAANPGRPRERHSSFALKALLHRAEAAAATLPCVTVRPEAGVGHFRINVTNGEEIEDASDLSSLKLDLLNGGWRYVNVQRRNLDSDGNETSVDSLLRCMKGAIPFSWGSVATGTAAEPTLSHDELDLSDQDVCTTAEYWITGPGLASGDTPPLSIDRSADDAWGMTLLMYAVFPFLNCATGAHVDPSPCGQMVKTCWNAIKADVDMYDAMNASSEKALGRAIADFVFAAVPVLIAAGVLVSTPFAVVTLVVVGAIAAGMGLGNFLLFVTFLADYPACARIEVWAATDSLGIIIPQTPVWEDDEAEPEEPSGLTIGMARPRVMRYTGQGEDILDPGFDRELVEAVRSDNDTWTFTCRRWMDDAREVDDDHWLEYRVDCEPGAEEGGIGPARRIEMTHRFCFATTLVDFAWAIAPTEADDVLAVEETWQVTMPWGEVIEGQVQRTWKLESIEF